MIEVMWAFGTVLMHMLFWAVGCPCHPSDFTDIFDLLVEKLSCPCRGLRVAEIVCGGFERFFQEIAELMWIDLFHGSGAVPGSVRLLLS